MFTMNFIINLLISIIILIAVALLPINALFSAYCIIAIIGLLIVDYIYNWSRELKDE